MKKILILLILLLLVQPFSSGLDIKKVPKTPITLGEWIKNNLVYIEEPWYRSLMLYEIRQTPEQTVKLGGGDCEDFAILVYSQLKDNYKTNMYSLLDSKSRKAHVITIVRLKDKTIIYSSNFYYIWTELEMSDIDIMLWVYGNKYDRIYKKKYETGLRWAWKPLGDLIWNKKL